MFLEDVSVKTVRDCIKIIFRHAAYETLRLKGFFHAVQLVTELTKGVDNQTLITEKYKTHSKAFKELN